MCRGAWLGLQSLGIHLKWDRTEWLTLPSIVDLHGVVTEKKHTVQNSVRDVKLFMGLCRYLESKILDKQNILLSCLRHTLPVQGLPSWVCSQDIESEVHVGGCTIIHMYNEIEKFYIQLRLTLYKLFIWLFLLFPPYRHAALASPPPQIIHSDNFPSFAHGKLCEFGTTLICLFSCLHHTSCCRCKKCIQSFFCW